MNATHVSFAAPTAALGDPRREIRAGAALIGIFLCGFVSWSAIARLDSAVHTAGVVRVSGERQAVQSLTGGIVSTLHVREGDHVAAGQPLIDFATTDALAEERSYGSRVFGLEAEIGRIIAERAGKAHVDAPALFATLTGEDRQAADRALAMEQAQLDSQRTLLASERAVLRQRIAQVGHQIDGFRKRQDSNDAQTAINGEELDSLQQLYRKGYATKTRVLALQREHVALIGEIGQTQAEMGRLRASANETQLQVLQLSDERQQRNAERLDAAQTELQTVLPQWRAAHDHVSRLQVRAPASGTVLGLVANTVGGVAAPGAKLMEIVPDRGELVVQTRVPLAEAGDLHPGQLAHVRLSLLGGRTLAPLDGRVRRVSADSIVDERSGQAFYTATVAVPRAELDRAGRQAGAEGGIRAGMPVEVTVPLQRRTALQYWLDPLLARLSPALSER